MKIQVLIHRQTEKEAAPGSLRAFVIQDGKRGKNLLRAGTVETDSAIEQIDRAIAKQFRLLEFPDIEYEQDYQDVKKKP